MGTFIIVLGIVIFALAGMGMWAIVVDIFETSIQEPIFNPILQYIANTRKKGALFFIPVCIIFMSIRKVFTYFPGWLFVYMCMSIYGYPTEKIYETLRFFILCTGMIATAPVVKEYYPNGLAYRKSEDVYDRSKPDLNTDNLFED